MLHLQILQEEDICKRCLEKSIRSIGNILIDILANDRKRKLQLYLMVSKEIGEEIKKNYDSQRTVEGRWHLTRFFRV